VIYVSSSCIKSKNIKEVIIFLAENGIKNIELSGGIDFYSDLKDDLISLKKEHKLNYLVHNYFPPPKEHFVLNLASLDNTKWQKCIDFLKNSIEFSLDLGVSKYSMHAGFYVDPHVYELGKAFVTKNYSNKKRALERFVSGYEIVKIFANGEIDLYIENNVVSFDNYKNYSFNPFMLTTFQEYEELKTFIDFNLLLDIGHLKVSANTLNLDFDAELEKFLPHTNYIHLSDNDGKNDLNLGIKTTAELLVLLKKNVLKSKIITLETYIPIAEIKRNIEILKSIISDG